MKTTFEEFEPPEDFDPRPLYDFARNAYRYGELKMLEKILELVKNWEKGLCTTEEFKKILKSYHKEFYGTKLHPMGD